MTNTVLSKVLNWNITGNWDLKNWFFFTEERSHVIAKKTRPSSELWNAFEWLHYPSLGLNAPWSNELFTHHFNAKIVDQFFRFLLLQRILKYLNIFLCSSKYSSTLDQLIYGKKYKFSAVKKGITSRHIILMQKLLFRLFFLLLPKGQLISKCSFRVRQQALSVYCVLISVILM